MRVTDLLSCPVVDEGGRPCGRVRDVRIEAGPARPRGGAGGFRVAGLVLGGGRLVHAWGFAEGRADGPWLLRALTSRAARRARFVPATLVRDWGPGVITVRGAGADLPRLSEVLQQ